MSEEECYPPIVWLLLPDLKLLHLVRFFHPGSKVDLHKLKNCRSNNGIEQFIPFWKEKLLCNSLIMDFLLQSYKSLKAHDVINQYFDCLIIDRISKQEKTGGYRGSPNTEEWTPQDETCSHLSSTSFLLLLIPHCTVQNLDVIEQTKRRKEKRDERGRKS